STETPLRSENHWTPAIGGEGRQSAAGRRGSSEDDLPLPLNRAPDLGDGRGLNPSPDEHRPAANRSMTHEFPALQPGEPDETRQAPLHRRFRRWRAASERQLAQRKRRVPKAQLRDLAELFGQLVELKTPGC